MPFFGAVLSTTPPLGGRSRTTEHGTDALTSTGVSEISGAVTLFRWPFWGQFSVAVVCETGNNGVALNLDVQDASAGVQDSWIFYGDSITQDGMAHDSRSSGGASVGNFSVLVNAARPQFFPAMEDGGIEGLLSADGASNIRTWLPMFNGRYVVLAYGTNDANTTPGDSSIAGTFANESIVVPNDPAKIATLLK